MEEHLAIEFPLRGEWTAPTTPAKKIPSHGTNRMGMRYAFDFLQLNGKQHRRPFHTVNALHYLLFGTHLENYYCYNQEIFAPSDGEIVAVIDGIDERKTVHWFVYLLIGMKHSMTFNEKTDSLSNIAGNYVVMALANGGYASFAHLKTNSIAVSVTDKLKKGSLIGKVGHSGNSTSPHLHFQLMDRADIVHANGIPFHFEQYELYQNNTWRTVYNQIPSEKDRFRFLKKE